MRDFSRSVMRHYSPPSTETTSRPASVPAPRWSAGLQDPVPSALPPAVQRTTAESTPEATGFGQPPLLPIDPIGTAPPAAPSVPEYVPREVFVAQPRSAAPIQRAEGDDTATETLPSHDLPTEYQGQAIPVDSRPVDPAIKRHMQLTRQREAKVVQNREQRLDRLLSEVPEPPAPEETATHSGRRIRPRGHIGVEYVQTKALADKREPTDHAPSSTPEPTPREPEPRPESVQRSESTDDDEVSTSAPSDAGTNPDAIQRAIEAAEAPSAHEPPTSDAAGPAETNSPDASPSEQSAASPSIQRAVSVDEALAFDDEPGQAEPDRSSTEAAPAPIQRAADAAPPVPFGEPELPVAPELSSAAADEVNATPPEPRDAEPIASTGETAPPVSPSIQRAPAQPPTAALPFDSPETAPDRQAAAQPSDSAPSIQRRDEAGTPPTPAGQIVHRSASSESSRPTVQRTPNQAEPGAPAPGEPAASAKPAPAQPQAVQRAPDAVPLVTAATSTDAAPPPAHVPSATPPSVQRTPDAPVNLPFDDTSSRAAPMTPTPDAPMPIQRSDVEDGISKPEHSQPVVDPAPSAPETAAASVQRAPDLPSSLPFDDPESTPETQPSAAAVSEPSPIQRAVEDSTATGAVPPRAVATHAPDRSPAVQRTADQPAALPVDTPPSAPDSRDPEHGSTPSIQRTKNEDMEAVSATAAVEDAPPSASVPPAPVGQRAPDAPAALPFDAADVSPDAPSGAPPAIQRVSDADAPVDAGAEATVQRTPDSSHVLTPDISPAVSQARPAEQQSVPDARRAPDTAPSLPFDTPAPSSGPEAPSEPEPIQHAVEDSSATEPDTAPSLPFDKPDISSNAEAPAAVQRVADDRSSPAAQSDTPAVPASPSTAPDTVLQRTPEPAQALPFDAPRGSDQSTASAPDSPLVQRDTADSQPGDGTLADAATESVSAEATAPAAPDVTQSPLPFDEPMTSAAPSGTPDPIASVSTVQRLPDAHETSKPEQAASVAETPHAVVQRAVDTPAVLPFEAPVTTPESPAPVPVQRDMDDDGVSEAPADGLTAAASAPEQPRSAVQREPDVSAPLPFDEPLASRTPSSAPTQSASAPPVQRVTDVHETSRPAPVASAAETPPVAVERTPDTASVLPFDDLPTPAEPPTSQGAAGTVQRRKDSVDGQVFAVSSPRPAIDRPDAHPIGRPRRIARSTTDGARRVQPSVEPSEPVSPESLPFDPIERPRPPEPHVQRMPDVPSPANPYAGMDLRQAMIAAGMIAPSPQVSADQPPAQGASIQRSVAEAPEQPDGNIGAGTDDTTNDIDLDVDQLAEDVMYVLRRRLRNEFDRLTGSSR
ncbi:MAG: hypothetical protein IPM16_01620 [Chloroflexi bacterium]|nr:hypothetical protein [Chloroflexota bacterium]